MNFKEHIIFEDDNYIIINKPPFVSTLQDRVDKINISDLAKEYYANAIVNHRLDKETSGVLVIAKSENAYRHFAILLENRAVDKYYQALVWGIHNFEQLLIEAPLRVSGSGKVSIDPRGKYSATIAKTIEKFKNQTLVECKLLTGKKHQIRIHLASANASIVHDPLYGGAPLLLSDIKKKYKPKTEVDELPISRRVLLHAKTIRFESLDGKIIEVTTDFPKDIELVLKQIRKNS